MIQKVILRLHFIISLKRDNMEHVLENMKLLLCTDSLKCDKIKTRFVYKCQMLSDLFINVFAF